MDDVAAPTPTRTRWLTPSVIGFGLASFLSDAGHEAATAALPGLLLLLGAQPAASLLVHSSRLPVVHE